MVLCIPPDIGTSFSSLELICLGLSSTVEKLCAEVPGIPLTSGISSSSLELRCSGLYLHIKKTENYYILLKKIEKCYKIRNILN